MLTSLSIQNYALIQDLRVQFGSGLIAITGETGAGKSILLGGLSLVLGKRADLSVLRDTDRKCIIEAEFNIDSYGLRPFFKKHDLDYEPASWIRREIHPGGRSRAFINDSPVTLDILTDLSARLIDVHSQHESREFTQKEVQMKVIDAVAENTTRLNRYSANLEEYRSDTRTREQLIEQQQEAAREKDYNEFLLLELRDIDLRDGIKQELENQQETLSNVESILTDLGQGYQALHEENRGILTQLGLLHQIASRIRGYGPNYEALYRRLESVRVELEDLAGDFDSLQQGLEVNPALLGKVNEELDQLYALFKKHGARDEVELRQIREKLEVKVQDTSVLEKEIEALTRSLEKKEKELIDQAEEISKRREAIIPELERKLETQLAQLGMPNATFKIELTPISEFRTNGRDELTFRFSANKGSEPGELKKVASGGELSRIMLSIKSILAGYEPLPTLVFDEIDTGVSGDISQAMGRIMKKMSLNMQIFAITHLPQVASKGARHYKVYKEDIDELTRTQIKLLSEDERIVELAEMLGGKTLTDSALAHARELLN